MKFLLKQLYTENEPLSDKEFRSTRLENLRDYPNRAKWSQSAGYDDFQPQMGSKRPLSAF